MQDIPGQSEAFRDSALLPFVPMVLAAYADGHLTPEEILRHWLDPEAPLSASQLQTLKRRLREDSEAHLRDPAMHARAFEFHEHELQVELGRRIQKRVAAGANGVDAFNAVQDHALALARAHIERFLVSQFQKAATEPPLADLCALFALQLIENDLAWFLENGYFEAGKARAIRKQVTALCGELTPHALALCDVFSIPAAFLGPLADADFLHASGLA